MHCVQSNLKPEPFAHRDSYIYSINISTQHQHLCVTGNKGKQGSLWDKLCSNTLKVTLKHIFGISVLKFIVSYLPTLKQFIPGSNVELYVNVFPTHHHQLKNW